MTNVEISEVDATFILLMNVYQKVGLWKESCDFMVGY